MKQHKQALIENLLEKSKRALEDAKLAIDNQRLETAQNRIYYSIFYIVSALAYLNNFSTSKHGQLVSWFNRIFIKEKIFDKELAITYKEAYENRMKSDYEFTYKPVEENVRRLFNKAEEFIQIVREYIKNMEDGQNYE